MAISVTCALIYARLLHWFVPAYLAYDSSRDDKWPLAAILLWIAASLVFGAIMYWYCGVDASGARDVPCEVVPPGTADGGAATPAAVAWEAASYSKLDCFYLAVITVTTVGYGDVRPLGGSRYVSMLLAVVGLLAFGLVVDAIGQMVSRARSTLPPPTPIE
ncbi:MAG: two pore domain potassium channel family protein [Deltaproteobacteria bacterium]|nr:two pore domain potassium channel family protein [Deltaproteobacteria bacterium]